ncbi:hypothetical protein OS31_46160 [Dickeya oryzae]
MHDWPGNIRELKAAAERWVLGLSPVPVAANTEKAGSDTPLTSLKVRLRRIERFLIQEALQRNDHCIDNVVNELGIPKRTLYHRIKLLNVAARGL